jgi:hypothetical protein
LYFRAVMCWNANYRKGRCAPYCIADKRLTVLAPIGALRDRNLLLLLIMIDRCGELKRTQEAVDVKAISLIEGFCVMMGIFRQ